MQIVTNPQQHSSGTPCGGPPKLSVYMGFQSSRNRGFQSSRHRGSKAPDTGSSKVFDTLGTTVEHRHFWKSLYSDLKRDIQRRDTFYNDMGPQYCLFHSIRISHISGKKSAWNANDPSFQRVAKNTIFVHTIQDGKRDERRVQKIKRKIERFSLLYTERMFFNLSFDRVLKTQSFDEGGLNQPPPPPYL